MLFWFQLNRPRPSIKCCHLHLLNDIRIIHPVRYINMIYTQLYPIHRFTKHEKWWWQQQRKKCHQRAFVRNHTNTLNIDINFSMNDMQWVFTRIITTVLARRRRQCDYVWLYMPSWGRQSLWIRLVELNWRQAHRPQYSQEWRSHISSTYQALYLIL